VAAEATRLGLEGHLGKAFPGPPRHDLVAAFGNLAQPGSPAIECEADGVKDGRLAGSGRPGNGEDGVGQKGRVGQINRPFADQGIEVLEPYVQDTHGR
jgi:hypothetical protein